ncbi:MAG: acyl-CoA-binding protein [Bacteroidetes bacterium]|nr:acyl-CoA-binding protein [Bacteroidota bacterium]MBS1757538.1 acyl-CoA-binding protein [Bacteroidota bacterium]
MNLQIQFETAVQNSKNLSQKPDNENLLKLYALYKQSTIGDINIDEPSNPFDFVNKAKYQAWLALKGKSKEKAMEDYIQLVTQLGG